MNIKIAAFTVSENSLNTSHTIHITFQEESFKIVIQQKAAYQTGNDKQIPIMCLADLNDLTVANNINAA